MRWTSWLATVSISALLLASCGGAPEQTSTPTTAGSEEPDSSARLDWALLLPIDTEGIFRLDLARLRRSAHYPLLRPLLDAAFEGLADLDDPNQVRILSSLVDRTDVILIGMLPEHEEGDDADVVVLLRGDYIANQIPQIMADLGEQDRSVEREIRGHTVWVGTRDSDPVTVAQPQRDTLVLTPDPESMESLLARMSMRSTSPRWPPAVRGQVESARLEEATVALVMASHRLGLDPGGGLGLSLAGRADLDGPLDLEVHIRVADPEAAGAVATMLEAMIEGMTGALAQSPDAGASAIARLIRGARVQRAEGEVIASTHLDRAEADAVLPEIADYLRREMADDAPAEAAPTPAPAP